MGNIIEIKNLSKTYGQGEVEVKALANVDLVIGKGEFVAIMGPSGCGKSTLLNMLGCLDKPNSGTYILDGKEVSKKTSSKTLAKIRRDKIGFIFQTFNLLSRTSVLNNVILPAVYSGLKNRRQKATELLARVGLAKRINHKSNELSGGEQQRVAIARSLMNNPEIILADEPTGNLDSKSGAQIMKLLKELNSDGKTIIAVTHDENIAKQTSRIVRMKDGKII
ncbi:MAG: hypothetical protein ACD_58C00071G0004 [uncultured bacterium]|nr:MAG: hypothetical protein ACD_58C00071G0004 [uncultured bacterium]